MDRQTKETATYQNKFDYCREYGRTDRQMKRLLTRINLITAIAHAATLPCDHGKRDDIPEAVNMCMRVYVFLCMYVCVQWRCFVSMEREMIFQMKLWTCACACVCVCMYACVCEIPDEAENICMHACVCVCICIRARAIVCVCNYAYMCICTCNMYLFVSVL
jgi:hypothetical protein